MAQKTSGRADGHTHTYDTEKNISDLANGHVHPLIKNNLGGVTGLGIGNTNHVHKA